MHLIFVQALKALLYVLLHIDHPFLKISNRPVHVTVVPIKLHSEHGSIITPHIYTDFTYKIHCIRVQKDFFNFKVHMFQLW